MVDVVGAESLVVGIVGTKRTSSTIVLRQQCVDFGGEKVYNAASTVTFSPH